jgi:hypothetical protein
MTGRIARVIVLAAVFSMATPGMSWARAPKKYQVTGKVLELTDELIVVEKGDEKWELARTPQTKVTGKLAVGSKVTIEYTMSAATAEVKEDKAADPKKK